MSLKALIFDVDGTLAETEEAHRAAFNAAFDVAGLGWVWDQTLYGRLLTVAGGCERLRAYRDETGADGPSDAALATLHADKSRRYKALVASGAVGLRKGVAELVGAARARGLKLAVATTTSRANVDALCRATWGAEAEEIFDVIASGDEVRAKKPDPELFCLALERLGLPPEHAIAVEDSPIGLAAAKAAGLRTVVTPSAYTQGCDFSDADWCAPDLSLWSLPEAALPAS